MQVNKLTESCYIPRTHELEEELLVEGPISWIKDKLSGKPANQAEADRKAREKTKKQIDKRKAKKDPKFLAKDLTSKNSKSTFYIDNKYDKPMNQNQWQTWLDKQQQKIDGMTSPEEQDKKDKAQAKFDAQRYNAIVVDENNYMMRRGAEDMEHAYQQLKPGINDEIRNGYFMEPYKYKKYGAVKNSKSTSKVNASDLKKFLTICETTYMTIVDDKGKQLDPSEVKNIPLDQIENYKVKLGNAGIKIPDWIKTAKSKKLI